MHPGGLAYGKGRLESREGEGKTIPRKRDETTIQGILTSAANQNVIATVAVDRIVLLKTCFCDVLYSILRTVLSEG